MTGRTVAYLDAQDGADRLSTLTAVTVSGRAGLRCVAIADDTRFVVSGDVLDCPLGTGRALLDTRTNTYFSLNTTGGFAWDRLREARTAGEVRAAMAESFDCDEQRCAEDLRALLRTLLDAGLIAVAPA